MELIIDAYNILKQVSPKLYVEDRERSAFIEKVVYYTHQRNNQAIIVFDGSPPDDKPLREQLDMVSVVYAGWNTQADTFIHQYVKKHKGRDLLLVSSDRQLCALVAEYKVPSVDALLFYKILQQARTHTRKEEIFDQKIVKIKINTQEDRDLDQNLDIDTIMEEACQEVFSKDEFVDDKPDSRLSSAYTPSKKERTFLKKIKKL